MSKKIWKSNTNLFKADENAILINKEKDKIIIL
jgi:hypothetical protein